MTDLINKVDEIIKTDTPSLQKIVDKYLPVLQPTRTPKQIPYLAYVIDKSVTYLIENHNDLTEDWKSWSVVVVKNKYLDGEINTDKDIPKTIDEFVSYWKSEYVGYCENIIAATEYDRDRGFTYNFLWKEKGVD